MIKDEITLSPEFKKQTTKAIISIVLFALVYLLIVVFAIALTILCAIGGIALIIAVPRFITIALGIGLASMGFFVLFFLIKFIFTSNKVDRSHLTEIKEADQPTLFKMIREIVKDVGTSFPKRVYLSNDVNAAVFYDSSFWSMFLPIRKNLQIGLGLVNSVQKDELKAILSHEFGHFSQRTMKVGSYVYNVNQVIYNMLYDNASFDRVMNGWASTSGYFAIFIIIAVKIIEGIQWILRKMYDFVNKSYMGLSREMEFHADEIAANITGFDPLKQSLLRLNLASYALNAVYTFYNGKIEENIKSENVFREQRYLMQYFAAKDNIPLVNDLPGVTLEHYTKFNKSKLNIEDQWASHPSTEDRIKRLEATNLIVANPEEGPANELFRRIEQTQEQFTTKLFDQIQYKNPPATYSMEEFKEAYEKSYLKGSFPEIFNGYYDNTNPNTFRLEEITDTAERFDFEELYSEQNTNQVYETIALENDIKTIRQIADKTLRLKTFDYDGKKYTQKESKLLLKDLEEELKSKKEAIKQNDIKIYKYFTQLESRERAPRLKEMYTHFLSFDESYDSKYKIYVDLTQQLNFINYDTPFEKINENFKQVREGERFLKANIELLMENEAVKATIPMEVKENFEKYLTGNLYYFSNQNYKIDNLNILLAALNDYGYLLSNSYFTLKKALLEYQASLLK